MRYARRAEVAVVVDSDRQPPREPGERLVVTGTVFKEDGKTPASNIRTPWFHLTADLQKDNETVADNTTLLFGLRAKMVL